jgi:hypothetical protein
MLMARCACLRGWGEGFPSPSYRVGTATSFSVPFLSAGAVEAAVFNEYLVCPLAGDDYPADISGHIASSAITAGQWSPTVSVTGELDKSEVRMGAGAEDKLIWQRHALRRGGLRRLL